MRSHGMCICRTESQRSIVNHPDLMHRLDDSASPKYVLLTVKDQKVIFHRAGDPRIWEATLQQVIDDPEFTKNLGHHDLLFLANILGKFLKLRI